MQVSVVHTTRLRYDAYVVEGVMDVRLGPRSDADQRWQQFDLRAAPSAAVRPYQDGFGNTAHLVTIARPHDAVELVSRSVVETLLDDPFRLPAVPPPPLRPSELADYLTPSTIVPADPALRDLAGPFRPTRSEGTLEAVQGLMGLVYEEFEYEPHVTTVATTVPEVLRGRTGVCQDFAHVLIGLCRSIELPARYVSGYIVPRRPDPSPHPAPPTDSADRPHARTWAASGSRPAAGRSELSRGAGASHAWVEVYTPTHGWRGFDPTNNLLASTYHVKMAIGRDYNDVPPTRGTFRGIATEELTVVVEARILGA